MSADDFRPEAWVPRALRPAPPAPPRAAAYAVMLHPSGDATGAAGVYGPFPALETCLDYAPSRQDTGAGTVHIYQHGGGEPDRVLYDWRRDHWQRRAGAT